MDERNDKKKKTDERKEKKKQGLQEERAEQRRESEAEGASHPSASVCVSYVISHPETWLEINQWNAPRIATSQGKRYGSLYSQTASLPHKHTLWNGSSCLLQREETIHLKQCVCFSIRAWAPALFLTAERKTSERENTPTLNVQEI